MTTRNKGTGRYDESRMAETMYADRVARDAKRRAPPVDSRGMYYRGVHDAIEFMNGLASSGVSPDTISSLLSKLSAQTAD